jgi:hypothetical protein
MRPESLAIITFVVSLVAYSWIGVLWYLYDSFFSLGGFGSSSFALVEASKIQTVGFFAFFGAIGTAAVVYAIENHYFILKSRA